MVLLFSVLLVGLFGFYCLSLPAVLVLVNAVAGGFCLLFIMIVLLMLLVCDVYMWLAFV